jgi:hypothetical protein
MARRLILVALLLGSGSALADPLLEALTLPTLDPTRAAALDVEISRRAISNYDGGATAVVFQLYRPSLTWTFDADGTRLALRAAMPFVRYDVNEAAYSRVEPGFHLGNPSLALSASGRRGRLVGAGAVEYFLGLAGDEAGGLVAQLPVEAAAAWSHAGALRVRLGGRLERADGSGAIQLHVGFTHYWLDLPSSWRPQGGSDVIDVGAAAVQRLSARLVALVEVRALSQAADWHDDWEWSDEWGLDLGAGVRSQIGPATVTLRLHVPALPALGFGGGVDLAYPF